MSVLFWNFMKICSTVFLQCCEESWIAPEEWRKNPVFMGLNGTSWKCSQLFLVSSRTYPEISLKSVQPFFRNIASRQTDRQTNEATDNDENITFAMAEVIITEKGITNGCPHIVEIWVTEGCVVLTSPHEPSLTKPQSCLLWSLQMHRQLFLIFSIKTSGVIVHPWHNFNRGLAIVQLKLGYS